MILVLVAHDGKTLQLDVSGSTRVDAVQQALVSVTGISVSDQIVMCHGARLDPAKPLAAYRLPQADAAAAEDTPVFLYHKQYLRPGAAPPPREPLPVFEVTVPGLPHVGLRHPLHGAHSPLIRALPDYEAQFTQQLGEARAFCEATQQRLHKCRQLMSEQEVQARAADAARANVESHYNYIASIYAAFVDKYVAQHQAHSALLAQFGELSAALSSVPLPPQLQAPQWRVLADLQPRVRLAEWHESCSRSHQHFAQKVVELEGVFQLLRGDVERLFLQAPCVDLDALGQQAAEAEALVEEQASIVQVLSKDLTTVQGLVESVVAQLGSSAGGASLSGAAVHDSCAAVDTLLEQHLHSLLPRLRACDTFVAEFLLRCGEAKACMTRDVLSQLQGIAAQQSRIRDMKHKLALLHEVLSRQAAAFAELQAANRLPAAYRLALAECARRAAWREMYAAQAVRLAEHCGRITAKEGAKREAVNRQLERHLPHDLLAAAGLLVEPPHCTVSLPPSDTLLLPVTPQDIAKLPAAIQAAADAAAERTPSTTGDSATTPSSRPPRSSTDGSTALPAGSGSVVQRAGSLPSASRTGTPTAAAALTPRAVQASMLASTVGWMQRGDPSASTLAAGGVAAASASDLAVENARLRAELAGLLAQQAARELGESGDNTAAAAGGAGGAGAGASQLLAGTASSAALAAPSAAAGDGAEQQQQRPYGHGGVPVVPAVVSAPLPSVSAALQQAAQAREGASAAAATQRALTLGPVKAALAAKDELIAVLEHRVGGLAAELASYEGRITALEAQLTAQSAAATTAVVVAGSTSSSSGQLTTQQQQLSPQPSPQLRGVPSSPSGAGGGCVPTGRESVVPAFLLDATQGASFFQPAAPSAAAAAAAGVTVVAAGVTAAAASSAAAHNGQQQEQPGEGLAATQAAEPESHDAHHCRQQQRQKQEQEQAPEGPDAGDTDSATLQEPQPAADSGAHNSSSGVPPSAAPDQPPATPAALSVSEPDLRGVLVASPAAVDEAHRQEGPAPGSLRHRGSLDSAAAAAGGASGLTGLLSSSMHYLFHRSSVGGGTGGGSSSRGDEGGGSSNGTPGSSKSSPVTSPPPGSRTSSP